MGYLWIHLQPNRVNNPVKIKSNNYNLTEPWNCGIIKVGEALQDHVPDSHLVKIMGISVLAMATSLFVVTDLLFPRVVGNNFRPWTWCHGMLWMLLSPWNCPVSWKFSEKFRKPGGQRERFVIIFMIIVINFLRGGKQGTINSTNVEETSLELDPWGFSKVPTTFPRLG